MQDLRFTYVESRFFAVQLLIIFTGFPFTEKICLLNFPISTKPLKTRKTEEISFL